MAGTFEIYKDAKGEFRFRAVRRAGQRRGSSSDLMRDLAAREGLARRRRSSVPAVVLSRRPRPTV